MNNVFGALKSSLLLVPLASFVACGPSSASHTKEAWNSQNDPLVLRGDYQRTLATLPTEGELTVLPWSDTYWPNYQGGISSRWHHGSGVPFQYSTPTAAEVAAMSVADLSALSPAEKYDVYAGRFDYPTVAVERQRTHPTDATWEGICHGWSPAAINFAEPQPILAVSPAGVAIPFGSSDIKALLSYYQGQIAHAPYRMLGGRCDIDLTVHPEAASLPQCRDTNAGAFHVVLTNQLGLMNQGFVADVTRDQQVWNQPVHGFSSTILGMQAPSPGAAAGTVQEAVIETQMRYSEEVHPRWDASNGTGHHADGVKVYQYRVELDQNGAIIGGEWMSDVRPDFLWSQERPAFTGYYGQLSSLFEQSQSSAAFADPWGH